MESKGKDPKAVGETDEDLVKVDTKFLLRDDLLSKYFKSQGKDAKEEFIKRNAEFLLTATDGELLAYYLKSKIFGDRMIVALIPEVDIYKYEPWGLPTLAPFVSNEASSSCFFCPMVKNRATESGYWKETGSLITVGSGAGFKQVLTYYRGKPPRGESTDWVMFEYRLDRSLLADHKGIDPHSFVLCRLFNESNYPFPGERLLTGGNLHRSSTESVSSVYIDIKGEDGSNVADTGGSYVQRGFKSKIVSYLNRLMDKFRAPGVHVSCSDSVSSDHAQGKEGFSVGAAGGSSVQSNLELGSDSESDSSVSELMDMFQKPETELMLNVSTSSVQPNMYADGFTHLRFLTAPAAWEWFRGQVGNLIDSPEIKPFAQQVVEKCHNSPLIISAVGSALTAESPSQWWLAVQRLHFRRRGDTNDSLNPCIRYCYDRLKDHDVKTCFLYSALVLENRQIHRSVLVKFLITEGLLGGTTMVAYKRANDIISMLVKASLLEASNETMKVRMHNMIRDSALAILSSSTEGCQMFLGRGLGKLGAEQVDKYLIKIGDQLKEPPPPEEWEQATVIFLMDNDFSTLPSKLYCPTLVSLFLQRNRYLRTVPASFFDGMHSLTNLNLSRTRIRSLPDSLFTLKSLQVLLLRDCEHLIILPSAIGRLTTLQVLDLQGTELLNLPDTISELASLKTLKVSFYGSINHNEYNNLPRKLIGDGTISNLPLEELGMFVHPGDCRWTNSVSDITKEEVVMRRNHST